MNPVQSTGTSVTESNAAAITAKLFAKAIGWKSFPACHVKVNTGKKARMTISIAKKIGRVTFGSGMSQCKTGMLRLTAVTQHLLRHQDGLINEHPNRDGV